MLRGVAAHVHVRASEDDLHERAGYAIVTISLDAEHVLPGDVEHLVVADRLGVIVLDRLHEVALRTHADLLGAGAILESELVVAATARCRLRANAAPRARLGQLVRRDVRSIEQRADDDRAIDIAAEEAHEHLHPDARDELKTPARARPRLRNAQPARALVVVLAVEIPMELDLDTAMLVGVDVFSGRADDRGGLEHLPDCAARTPRSQDDRIRSTPETGLVDGRTASRQARLMTFVRDPRRHPAAGVAPSIVVLERETVTWCEAPAERLALRQIETRARLFEQGRRCPCVDFW